MDLWTKSTLFVLTVLTFLYGVHTEEYFCGDSNNVEIRDDQEGSIITRKNTEASYSNNLHCAWTILANQSTQVIQVKVLRSHLQWSPEGSICQGYDYVQVFDGSTSQDQELLTWCGENNPHFFTTTGPEAHIVFVSNDRNKFAFTGVHLAFTIVERQVGPGSCPPGWQDDLGRPEGGDSCYVLRTEPETWIHAQTHCNFDQANLVSVSSLEEDSFISQMVQNSSLSKVWLSLNDIQSDGIYRWLDGSTELQERWRFPNQIQDTYSNCVVLNKEGKWELEFCNEDDVVTTVLYPYICEKLKVGENELYPLPQSDTIGDPLPGEDDIRKKSSNIGIILGCCIGAFIVIVAIVVVVVLKVLRRGSENNSGSRRCTSNVSARRRQTPSPSRNSRGSDTPPPSYNLVMKTMESSTDHT